MAIPSQPEFESLLSSITVARPANAADWEPLEILAPEWHSDGKRLWPSDGVTAWARAAGPLTMSALLRRLAKELAAKGHPSNDRISKIILGIFTYLRGSGSAVQILNELLDGIGPVDCTQYLVAPFSPLPGTVPFVLSRFRVGLLDIERMRYWCRKVDCDFFERYPREFANCFAIESEHTPVRILQVREVVLKAGDRGSPIPRPLLDAYFNAMTEALRSLFEQEFLAAQEVLVAAGAPLLDVSDPKMIFNFSFVALYCSNSAAPPWGYFCPLNMAPTMDWANADRRIPQTSEILKARFGFEALGPEEIFAAIRMFSKFVTRAVKHETHGQLDEAFLHSVIALDLLLGSRDENTQTVCRRAAVLVSVDRGCSFSDALALMKDFYEARSRYVHAGNPVGDEALNRLKPVITTVFETLMRLQQKPKNRTGGFTSRWCKHLDYAALALETGRALSPTDLDSIGKA
jgi:hypothetical protein